jgi:hypothetical protein
LTREDVVPPPRMSVARARGARARAVAAGYRATSTTIEQL